jgi:hypothetical protein
MSAEQCVRFPVAMPQNVVPYLCGIHTGEAQWAK